MASPRAHALDQTACTLSPRPRGAREHEERASASLAGFRTRREHRAKSAEHQLAAPNSDRPDLLYKLPTTRIASPVTENFL